MMKTPDYQKIYRDMIRIKYPEKAYLCHSILKKKDISIMDVILLNSIISGQDHKKIHENQKLKAYDKSTILQILEYQKKYKMNNSQLANHFNLSRNTVAKWRAFFI